MTVPPELVEKATDQAMVLLTEKCLNPYCVTPRYSELTDEANTHWHVKRGVALVPVESLVATAVQAERERIAEYVRTNPCEA